MRKQFQGWPQAQYNTCVMCLDPEKDTPENPRKVIEGSLSAQCAVASLGLCTLDFREIFLAIATVLALQVVCLCAGILGLHLPHFQKHWAPGASEYGIPRMNCQNCAVLTFLS